MALSHRATSLIIKSSCGVYSTVHIKKARSRIIFLLFFIKSIPQTLDTDSWHGLKLSRLSELHILVCSALSRAFSQECSWLLPQQQRLSTMTWMKKKVTPHRHSQPYDFHPALVLRNAVTYSSLLVVGEKCFAHQRCFTSEPQHYLINIFTPSQARNCQPLINVSKVRLT